MKLFIADTSRWIDHLRKPDSELAELLREKRILIHPVVLGELACGSFKKRREILGNLKLLPKAEVATFDEVAQMIEENRLYGSGLGFSDVQLLASALISEAGILTRDRAMLAAMKVLGIYFRAEQ